MDESFAVEREVADLEREVGRAITRGDRAALGRLLADDFSAILPDCRTVSKAEVIEQITSPDYELESLVNDEVRVRVFGEVAVATARGTARGRYRGKDASGQFRYTRIWARRNGQWQAVAAQSTMMPPTA